MVEVDVIDVTFPAVVELATVVAVEREGNRSSAAESFNARRWSRGTSFPVRRCGAMFVVSVENQAHEHSIAYRSECNRWSQYLETKGNDILCSLQVGEEKV